MLRLMRPQSIDSSKKMNDTQAVKNLQARVEILEQNLDLSLKTISVLATQCKQAAVIIESLSAGQLNQQGQIQELASAIDGMAVALGLFPENFQTEDDDTWN